MDAATALQSRLIGAILVEKNLITGDQLERALALQADSGERLGEIVVAEFGVSRLELASVLAEQWAELETVQRANADELEPEDLGQPAQPLTPGEVQIRRPLGEIFVELGFVSSEQLDAALERQRETGARIGEILVEQGSLTRLDLASALAEQWSALQKLRPPAPVAEPQPWQNGTPTQAPVEPAPTVDDRAAVAGLEERLRVLERASAATPSQVDVRLATSELRSAIDALASRLENVASRPADAGVAEALEGVSRRLEALESSSTLADLVALRAEFEELRARPVTVEGIDELRAGLERLEQRPDHAGELEQLATELADLGTRLEELAGLGELGDKLEAVAGQAEVAQTGIAALSHRIDELAGLGDRIDDVASRLPNADVIDELRLSLSELSARTGAEDREADIASLAARVDQLSAHVENVAATPVADVSPLLEELSERLDTVAASIPVVDADDLTARLDALGEAGRAGSEALSALTGELHELGERTQERLDEIAAREPDLRSVDELRARLEEVAAAAALAPDPATMDELREQLDVLTARVYREPDLAPLDALRARLDALTAAVVRQPELLEELREQLEALAVQVQRREDDPAPLEELRGRVDGLAAAVERGPEMLDELRARVDDLATREQDLGPLDELRDRVDELAARGQDLRPVEELRERLEEVAAAAERAPDPAPLEELRGVLSRRLDVLRDRVDQLADASAPGESVDEIAARVVELERRLAATLPAAEVIEEMRRVAESSVVDRESLAQALFARVEEITATVPREDELAALRERLDDLAARPMVDAGLQERVESLASRIDGLDAAETSIAELRASLESLDGIRVGDALATGARLARLEAAIGSLVDLESRIRDDIERDAAERAEALQARLTGAEARLDEVGALDARIAAVAADLAGRPDGEAFAAVLAELEALASRPVIADPSDRLLELSQRLDRAARDGHDRVVGLGEELNARLSGVADDLSQQVAELASGADGYVRRDEAAATAAAQEDWLRTALEALRESAEARATAVDQALQAAADARRAEQEELSHRLEHELGTVRAELQGHGESLQAQFTHDVAAVRSDLDARDRALGSRIEDGIAEIRADLAAERGGLDARFDAGTAETVALRAEIAELQSAVADRTAWEARLESTLERRFDALARRVTEEVAGARAEATDAMTSVREEQGVLAGRIGELLAVRQTDVEATRAANDRLAEQVEILAGLREDDADAARAAAADLSERLEQLVASLNAEAADAAAAVERVSLQVEGLHGLRAEDLAAAELAGADLSERLEEHARLAAAAASELERALRDELGGVAARLEERDVQGIEAREELRAELERAASSVGWRLERIEESLASSETADLKALVADLEQRLDGQVALSEEQARVTERALRKGLAKLGAKLVDNESAYADAGKALRRSIERLGAAVVEADARMADQIPVSDAEGYVAFAPTAAGYRLVELPGTPPEIGSTVEIEGGDGALVITRYGRSPLPLDGRACAYLDRA